VRYPEPMKALQLTREYPPHIYGGAGVVVDQLTQALTKRMKVEVRCFGEREPTQDGVVVRGYTPWERLKADKSGEPRFAPALETLSIGLAMARDPVDADVAHAHTWYADMPGSGSARSIAFRLSSRCTAWSRCGRGRPTSSARATCSRRGSRRRRWRRRTA